MHGTGEWEVCGDGRAETRFHFHTGSTSVVPWLVVSGSESEIGWAEASRGCSFAVKGVMSDPGGARAIGMDFDRRTAWSIGLAVSSCRAVASYRRCAESARSICIRPRPQLLHLCLQRTPPV